MTTSPWRGILVILSWSVWLPLYPVAESERLTLGGLDASRLRVFYSLLTAALLLIPVVALNSELSRRSDACLSRRALAFDERLAEHYARRQ
jgi:hypothetical protein